MIKKNKIIFTTVLVLFSLFSILGFSKEIDLHYRPTFLNDNQDYLNGLKSEVLQQKIIEWLGTPYRGGSNSLEGTDCSGFVQMVYRDVYNVDLTRSSSSMIKEVKKIRKMSDFKEGDILFFKIWRHRISHVGIYLHDGLFVHASTSNGVEIASLTMPYYKKTFFRAGRVLSN
jgi:lipoprotein Spr/probable lipoprotein NlpC